MKAGDGIKCSRQNEFILRSSLVFRRFLRVSHSLFFHFHLRFLSSWLLWHRWWFYFAIFQYFLKINFAFISLSVFFFLINLAFISLSISIFLFINLDFISLSINIFFSNKFGFYFAICQYFFVSIWILFRYQNLFKINMAVIVIIIVHVIAFIIIIIKLCCVVQR